MGEGETRLFLRGRIWRVCVRLRQGMSSRSLPVAARGARALEFSPEDGRGQICPRPPGTTPNVGAKQERIVFQVRAYSTHCPGLLPQIPADAPNRFPGRAQPNSSPSRFQKDRPSHALSLVQTCWKHVATPRSGQDPKVFKKDYPKDENDLSAKDLHPMKDGIQPEHIFAKDRISVARACVSKEWRVAPG